MTGSALWFLTRASGVVTLVLLTGTVLLGMLGPLKARSRRWPAFATVTLHRDVALLGLTTLGVHIATSVADPYAPIRAVDAVLPFASAYRPVWLGLGALALDLLLAIGVTTALRRLLGPDRWRRVHLLAYVAWPVAVVHELGTGSDVRSPWLVGLTAGLVAAVVAALLARAAALRSAGRRARAVVAAALGLPLVVGAWAVHGPLAPGWAARSGTPPKPAVAAPAALLPATTPAATAAADPLPAAAAVSGTVASGATADGRARLDLDLRVAGTNLALRVALVGPAGGLPTEGGLLLGAAGAPATSAGSVTSVTARGQQLVLTLRVAGRDLRLTLVPGDGSAVTGTLVDAPPPPAQPVVAAAASSAPPAASAGRETDDAGKEGDE